VVCIGGMTTWLRLGGDVLPLDGCYREQRDGIVRQDLVELYRKAALYKGIKKAKEESWDALIQTIDDDPWGSPLQGSHG